VRIESFGLQVTGYELRECGNDDSLLMPCLPAGSTVGCSIVANLKNRFYSRDVACNVSTMFMSSKCPEKQILEDPG